MTFTDAPTEFVNVPDVTIAEAPTEFERYNYLTYLIVPVSELIWVDFDQVVNEHPDVLRTAVGEEQAIIKWDGPEPDFVMYMMGTSGPFTHEEIHFVLEGPEWFKHYSETHHPKKTLPAGYVP